MGTEGRQDSGPARAHPPLAINFRRAD